MDRAEDTLSIIHFQQWCHLKGTEEKPAFPGKTWKWDKEEAAFSLSFRLVFNLIYSLSQNPMWSTLCLVD